MAKDVAIQDDIREMVFPYLGIDLSRPTLQGRPEYTEVADNVRFFEPLTGRGRGGSRPGIDKFAADQVSGDHEIQLLTSVVAIDGQMIDWSFDGPEQLFPGIYAGITLFGFPFEPLRPMTWPEITDDGNPFSETFDNDATSGYPPKKPKNDKIVVTITTASEEVELNTNNQLTALLRNKSGGFLDAETLTDKNIILHTDPPGKDGDGDFGSAGGSELTPLVQDSVEGKVYYWVTVKSVTGVVVAKSNVVHVKYIEAPSSPPVLDETQGESTSSPAASLAATFFFNPLVDTLVLVFVATDTAGVTSNVITDSQGNTYTLILSVTGDPPLKLWVYRTRTVVSAALTVTVTPNTSTNISVIASTIIDADATFPVGGTASNSGTATDTADSATTTTIPVITPNSLVFGFFAQNSGTGLQTLNTSGTGMGGVDTNVFGTLPGTGSAAVHTASSSVSVNTAVKCSNAAAISCAYQAIGISIRG